MGKKKNKATAESMQAKYEKELTLLKAKQKQLNGIIEEAKLFLEEIKTIRDGMKQQYETENYDSETIVDDE